MQRVTMSSENDKAMTTTRTENTWFGDMLAGSHSHPSQVLQAEPGPLEQINLLVK